MATAVFFFFFFFFFAMIPVLRNVSFLFPGKIYIVFIDVLVWMLVFKILNNAFDGELL